MALVLFDVEDVGPFCALELRRDDAVLSLVGEGQTVRHHRAGASCGDP